MQISVEHSNRWSAQDAIDWLAPPLNPPSVHTQGHCPFEFFNKKRVKTFFVRSFSVICVFWVSIANILTTTNLKRSIYTHTHSKYARHRDRMNQAVYLITTRLIYEDVSGLH